VAHRIIWSPEAVEDLESIGNYIERDSLHYAKTVISKIIKQADKLSSFPKIGRIIPEISNELFRETFLYSYRIIYFIDNNNIKIIGIIHGKRDFDSLKERFE
jgi:addiction module RelE/StbE family toxin